MKIKTIKKGVAAAGTAERLSATDFKVQWVRIQAEDDNTGVVYVGGSDVAATNGIELRVSAAAEVRSVPAVEFSSVDVGGFISLRDIWLDVGTNADGVIATYFVGE